VAPESSDEERRLVVPPRRVHIRAAIQSSFHGRYIALSGGIEKRIVAEQRPRQKYEQYR
jgi:hypothetical protein